MSIIKLENVIKFYNKGKANQVEALRGVNFEVEKGESVAVMGVSGSGKSTLLHVIGCIDNYTSGTYELKGKKLETYTQNEIARVRNKCFGFVLQQYGLLENDKVYDNVALPLYFSGDYKNKQIKAKVVEVLDKLGIGDLAKRKVKQLSGGQKQRVAIARAIINNPDIILADEPTGALDSKTAKEIMGIFKKLQADGKTIIMVTHDKAMADFMDRTVHIVDGKILETETTAEAV